MKKATIFIIALVLLLALAACGGSSTASSGSTAASDTTSEGTPQPASVDGTSQPIPVDGTRMPFQGEMPDSMALAYGIFQLEESDVPIDAAQAATLLPLWKAARSLSASDTVATAEIEALWKQIRSTLSAEQQQVIDTAEFSPEQFAALGEKYGLTMGFGPGGGGQMDESTRATVEAMRASGQMPQRGQGGGPGFGPGGGEGGMIVGGPGGGEFAAGGDPSAMQTAVAENGGSRGARMGLNSALLDAIITFLEGKVQ